MSNWSQAFHLRNRFHAAVYVFSNRSQNMSQCSNSGTRDTTKCVTDFLTTFFLSSAHVYSNFKNPQQHGIYLFYTSICYVMYYYPILNPLPLI